MTNEVIDPRLTIARDALLKEISDKYEAFAQLIAKLPLNPEFKVNALLNVNQGYLWVKEGISLVQFKFEMPEQPIPPTEQTIEVAS